MALTPLQDPSITNGQSIGPKIPAAVQQSLSDTKAWQTEAFRRIQRELHEFAGDAFANAITDLVVAMYKRKSKVWNKDAQYHRYLPVVPMMQRTLAVMAHQSPESWLEKDGERLPEDDRNSKLWRRDEQDIRFGSLIRKIDRQNVLHRTLVVNPAWSKGRMQWIRWLPQNVHVNQDLGDISGIADAPFVHLAMPTLGVVDPVTRPTILYQTWQLESDGTRRLWVHDQHGRQMDNSLFADNVSRYTDHDGEPVYPLAVWRDDEVDEGEFFLPARASWWAEQRYICRALMAIAYAGDFQLYSIPLLKNWSGEDPAISIDPAEPIVTTNPNADLEFRTPAPNIEAVENHVESSLRRHAVAEGLPSGIWSSDQTAKNLAAMRMEFQALNERREEHISDYSAFIRETWKAHVAVANYHRPGEKYDRGVQLRVKWMPIPLPRDEFQHSQAVAKQIELGLTHPVDELMERHNLSRVDAERLWLRNLTDSPEAVAARHGLEVAPSQWPPSSAKVPAPAAAGDGVPRPPDVRDT